MDGLAINFANAGSAPLSNAIPAHATETVTPGASEGAFADLIALLLAPTAPAANAEIPAESSGSGATTPESLEALLEPEKIARALIRTMLVPGTSLPAVSPETRRETNAKAYKDDKPAQEQADPARLGLPPLPVLIPAVSMAAGHPLSVHTGSQPAQWSATQPQPANLSLTARLSAVRSENPASALAFRLEMMATAEPPGPPAARELPPNHKLPSLNPRAPQPPLPLPAALHDAHPPQTEPARDESPKTLPQAALDRSSDPSSIAPNRPHAGREQREAIQEPVLPAPTMIEPRSFVDRTLAATQQLPPQDPSAIASVSPHQATASVLRESEPPQPAAAPRATFVQEIGVRVARTDASPVDVQIIERAGHVRVDVRTPDPILQTSLRQDLGTLVNSLERTGFRTEAFVPADSPRSTPSLPALQSLGSESGATGFGQREGRRDRQDQQHPRHRRQRNSEQVESMEAAA